MVFRIEGIVSEDCTTSKGKDVCGLSSVDEERSRS
jgi:hypothetical protein